LLRGQADQEGIVHGSPIAPLSAFGGQAAWLSGVRVFCGERLSCGLMMGRGG